MMTVNGVIDRSADGTRRLILTQYDDAPKPRGRDTDVTSVITIDRRDYNNIDETGGELALGWNRVREHPRPRALALFESWASYFHKATLLVDLPDTGPHAIWYLTADTAARLGIDNPEQVLRTERDRYRAWASGDIWDWRIVRKRLWVPLDAPDSDERHTTWETVEESDYIYGYDMAERDGRHAWELM